MILVTKTFSVVTPESARDGDFSETGIDFENEPFTFRELVATMKAHYQPSCYPVSGNIPVNVWFSSGADVDYVDGSETFTSIHFSMNNKPRSEKYWIKAAKAAGIIR
jgi:hypothetical protein